MNDSAMPASVRARKGSRLSSHAASGTIRGSVEFGTPRSRPVRGRKPT